MNSAGFVYFGQAKPRASKCGSAWLRSPQKTVRPAWWRGRRRAEGWGGDRSGVTGLTVAEGGMGCMCVCAGAGRRYVSDAQVDICNHGHGPGEGEGQGEGQAGGRGEAGSARLGRHALWACIGASTGRCCCVDAYVKANKDSTLNPNKDSTERSRSLSKSAKSREDGWRRVACVFMCV